MGKLTLLIVAAAITGGAVLKLGMHLTAGDTARDRSESQADLLSRQIAESGQSLVLSAMVGEDGFQNPGITGRDYDGGAFTVNVDELSADRQSITVTVEGRYGGAVHTVQSTYAFDPMEYPGPIWLDVPYATASVPDAAQISGTAADHPVRLDSRKFSDLNLDRYLSETTMRADLAAGMVAGGSVLSVPRATDWAPIGPLLEDLSRQNDIGGGEDLYQATVSAMGASDVTYAAARTVSATETWGGTDRVTRVRGDLTVTGRLTGSGVLIVEGALKVLRTGQMAWTGLVIVRDQRQLLQVNLDGDADITGGLVVVQDALPPGGHLDLTVMRAPGGMTDAVGQRPSPNWPARSPIDYAWYEHTHEFDQKPLAAPRGRRIVFAENGAGRHEEETRFWETVRAAGSESVYLEFRNPENHGFARYSLGLTTERDSVTGMVRNGFGPFAAAGNVNRSRPFGANALRTLVLNVQSLRALQDRFDGQGTCSGNVWPFCIGRDWNRASALSVRLVRARDNRTLYDAAVYWHMRADEVTAHQAEETAWVASLRGGTGFGTNLTMGPQASVTYQLRGIARLSEKLGFDGNEVRLVSTQSEHISAAEMRARAIGPGGALQVCHRSGPGQTTVAVNATTLALHLGHGDRSGACPTSGGSGSRAPGPAPTPA